MSRRLVNLTEHPVVLEGPAGRVELPGAERPARCTVSETTRGVVEIEQAGAIPVVAEALGNVEGLPPPAPGVLFVVSRVVAAAAIDRADLVVPTRLVRDATGRVVAARALLSDAVDWRG